MYNRQGALGSTHRGSTARCSYPPTEFAGGEACRQSTILRNLSARRVS